MTTSTMVGLAVFFSVSIMGFRLFFPKGQPKRSTMQVVVHAAYRWARFWWSVAAALNSAEQQFRQSISEIRIEG